MFAVRSLWPFLAAALAQGCAVDSNHPTLPLEVTAAASKADSPIGSCEQDHQSSPDITVLSARTRGRVGSSTNTVPAQYNVNCSRCDELRREASSSYDCQFYDECLDLSLDCSSQLERMTGLPFLGEATFNVWYTKVTYPEDAHNNDAGNTVERYRSEGFNCQFLEITTVSRSAALPDAWGIGFYYDGQISYHPMAELERAGTVTLSNGESGTLHRFGGLAECWAGSTSSSAAGVTEFKPFLLFEGDGICYFNWDEVPTNYRIGSGVSSFDRSGELLR